MLSLHVTVPIACFRKGMAREFLETEPLPPPATCYGMLLSLVGESDRHRHIGVRVTAGLLSETETSVVLRTVWRVKSRPLGSSGNTRPDYQQLLTGASTDHPFIELIIYLDSSEETDQTLTLEQRVQDALNPIKRHTVNRFGGLSLGESTHMIDSISIVNTEDLQELGFESQQIFLEQQEGLISLPVWVDHVGSANTRYCVGDLTQTDLSPPDRNSLPKITSAA